MKLQRYDFRAAHILLAESDDGNLVRYEDVVALEAENERLRAKLARYKNDGTTHAAGCWAWGPKHYECALAEIERLKAPPKVLSAEEVTTPGFYWFKFGDGKTKLVLVVSTGKGLSVRTFAGEYGVPDSGVFFGPLNLTPPEV